MPETPYLLGTHTEELERLRFQHTLWRPMAQAAWQRAGLQKGQSVLDLGAGPGFAAADLADVVGPEGRVLGLERSEAYVASGRRMAEQAGLHQLELRQQDLLSDPWPADSFDLIWCRWVAMFLPQLEPLLKGVDQCISPGGRWLIHEYVHWDTFGLHPHGQAIRRFGRACQASFRHDGGDPDVNRKLPGLLHQRGWQIEHLKPIPVLGDAASMAGQWMERFVLVFGQQLQHLGYWTADDALEAQEEIARAHADPGCYWVGPTVLEVLARRP